MALDVGAALEGGNLMTGVGRLGAKLGDLTTIAIYIAIVGGIVYLIYRNVFLYKHNVIVRELSKDGTLISKTKARTIKIQGVEYWKLKTKKDRLPVPPSSARGITKKGKTFAECYYSESGGYHWLQDNFNRDTLEAVFNVFPTKHKVMWIHQQKQALDRLKKSGFEVFMQLLPSIMVVIILVAFMAFYGDIMETNEAAMETAWSNINKMSEQQSEALDGINKAVRVLAGDETLTVEDLDIDQDVPLSQQTGNLSGGIAG